MEEELHLNETIDVYADQGVTTIGEPTNYGTGAAPLESLPAGWWNWLWHMTTSKINDATNDVTDIYNELVNVIEHANISLDTADNEQLYKAIVNISQTLATEKSAGSVKSSDDNGKVSVDDDGYMTANGLGDVNDLEESVKDDTVVGAINRVTDTLSGEIGERQKADSDLSDRISQEIDDRSNADGELQKQIDYLYDNGSQNKSDMYHHYENFNTGSTTLVKEVNDNGEDDGYANDNEEKHLDALGTYDSSEGPKFGHVAVFDGSLANLSSVVRQANSKSIAISAGVAQSLYTSISSAGGSSSGGGGGYGSVFFEEGHDRFLVFDFTKYSDIPLLDSEGNVMYDSHGIRIPKYVAKNSIEYDGQEVYPGTYTGCSPDNTTLPPATVVYDGLDTYISHTTLKIRKNTKIIFDVWENRTAKEQNGELQYRMTYESNNYLSNDPAKLDRGDFIDFEQWFQYLTDDKGINVIDNISGKDFYIYLACLEDFDHDNNFNDAKWDGLREACVRGTMIFVLSTRSDAPTDVNTNLVAYRTRKIGQFHTLCKNAGKYVTASSTTAVGGNSDGGTDYWGLCAMYDIDDSNGFDELLAIPKYKGDLDGFEEFYTLSAYGYEGENGSKGPIADKYNIYSNNSNSHNGHMITNGSYWYAENFRHPLDGWEAGDILPESVWCITFSPGCDPSGMVYCKEDDIAVDIYLQTGKGQNTKSIYSTASSSSDNDIITVSRQQINHANDMMDVGKRLLYDSEFTHIALGSNTRTAIYGSNQHYGTGGNTDTKGRRMISSIGCEDCCGSEWQWLEIYAPNGGSSWNNYDGGSYLGYYYGGSYGLAAGAYWNDSSYCGPRSRDAYAALSNVSTNTGARGTAPILHGTYWDYDLKYQEEEVDKD